MGLGVVNQRSAVSEGGSKSKCRLKSSEEPTVLNTGDDEGDEMGDKNIVVRSYSEDDSRRDDQRLILRTIAARVCPEMESTKLKTHHVMSAQASRVKTDDGAEKPRPAFFLCPKDYRSVVIRNALHKTVEQLS